MKLIISGTTGFIGTEILTQALASPAVTSIIALSRKPIAVSDPKLSVVIVDDFLTYTPEVLAKLEGADACIWTIGAKALNDTEMTKLVTVDYTMAATRAFSQLAGNQSKKFRFIQTSGVLSESSRQKKLWLFAEVRYISGSVETQILEFAHESKGAFEAIVVKPGAVLPKEGGLKSCVLKAMPWVEVQVLSAAMLDLACHGVKGDEKILGNDELVKLGKSILQREK